jgi:hypothetical protein
MIGEIIFVIIVIFGSFIWVAWSESGDDYIDGC